MKNEGYSIKDLEMISGVKAHTIRIWEKRYNLLNPERTDTNIRYYSDDDLRHILNVSLLVRNGYKISKVCDFEEERLKEKVLEVSEKKRCEDVYVERLLLCMLNFDNIGFYNLVTTIIDKMGLEEATLKVIFVLFDRIGTLWQVGSIFPAQEHVVTYIIRQKIIAAIDKVGIENTRGKTILFFLPENELHELSLLYYTYLAQKIGYNVIYLGQFVPFDDLRKLQLQLEVDYVFTVFVNPLDKKELEEYLKELKNLFRKQKIFVNGRQLNILNPDLPRNTKIVKSHTDFAKYLGG